MTRRFIAARGPIALALAVSAVWTVYASAKVYIDIDAPVFRRINIALPVFRNDGPVADESVGTRVADLLAKDLASTAYFRIVEPSNYLEDPRKSPSRSAPLDFRKWSLVNAEIVLFGGYRVEGARLILDARIYDPTQGKAIGGRVYEGTRDDLPTLVHRFANDVVYLLTGQRGIFETRIAYVTTEYGAKEIATMNFDGSNPRQVTRFGSVTISPSWRPDGGALIFTSYRERHPWLYLLDLATGDSRTLARHPGVNIGARWSPEGRRVALTLSKDGNSELYLMDADGGNLRRLTYNWGIDVSPTWSPDGTQLAFISDRSGSPHLYKMSVEGDAEPERLTYSGTFVSSPAWSPRGDWIAYSARVPRLGFQIFAISPDGLELRQLTNVRSDNESPTWSPDGALIAFNSNRSGRHQIYRMAVDGSELQRLTDGPGDHTLPAWSPIAGVVP